MLKRLILTMSVMLPMACGYAQTKAVTESGEEVLLYADGTWKSTAAPKPGWDTRLDTITVKKNEKNTFLVKGKKIKYGVWINPKKWTFTGEKNASIPAAEYFFRYKEGDVYAMTVPEGIQVNFESLPKVALKVAQNMDPNARIVHEDTRMVNGSLMKYVELRASTEGIDFVYLGYYYSGPEGIVRFLGFTSENLVTKYRKDIEDLLSGFTMDVK